MHIIEMDKSLFCQSLAHTIVTNINLFASLVPIYATNNETDKLFMISDVFFNQIFSHVCSL